MHSFGLMKRIPRRSNFLVERRLSFLKKHLLQVIAKEGKLQIVPEMLVMEVLKIEEKQNKQLSPHSEIIATLDESKIAEIALWLA